MSLQGRELQRPRGPALFRSFKVPSVGRVYRPPARALLTGFRILSEWHVERRVAAPDLPPTQCLLGDRVIIRTRVRGDLNLFYSNGRETTRANCPVQRNTAITAVRDLGFYVKWVGCPRLTV